MYIWIEKVGMINLGTIIIRYYSCIYHIQRRRDSHKESLRVKVYITGNEHISTDVSHILQDSLHWRHNGHDGISNYQPRDCLLNRLFRRRSNKTSKLRVTGLCAGNSPVPGEFSAQMASYAENVSIWWRHHVLDWYYFTVEIMRMRQY